jgi:hypothetical protein
MEEVAVGWENAPAVLIQNRAQVPERVCPRGPNSRFDRVGKIAQRPVHNRVSSAGDFAHPTGHASNLNDPANGGLTSYFSGFFLFIV